MTLRMFVCVLAIGICACRRQSQTVRPPQLPFRIVVAADSPTDVRGGAEHADLRTASEYAWHEFIAMNWPAMEKVRDTPDRGRRFGQPGGPVVWETFRSKVEIYPGDGSATQGPHGWNSGTRDYGYDESPLYTYQNDVPPCGAAAATPAWVNLDEISQIGFDTMHAGVSPGTPIHYLAKANRIHYRYVVANQYWYGFLTAGTPASAAAANFVNAVRHLPFSIPAGAPIVDFPDGTIEVKAAFRPLTNAEKSSGRFHRTNVRYYERGAGGEACYREDEWGLLALHIIHKTPSAPAWTWATFEQADNLMTTVGGKAVAVEDGDGNVLHPGPPNTPALHYEDGPYAPGLLPKVSKQGPFCADPGPRLFYQEIAVDSNGKPYENTPSGGNICVGERMHRIPPTIVNANRAAHRAIGEYERAHGLPPSPWHHYKLVNVQTWPFDKAEIRANDDSDRGAPTFYTANIVVETDYTLQNHSGGPETHTGAAPSDLRCNFSDLPQPPAEATYKNTYVLRPDRSLRARYNMGGCMGCHGLTQIVAGSDFSYILFESSVLKPEFPETKPNALTPRYVGRLKGERG